jgi:hypothetical protein
MRKETQILAIRKKAEVLSNSSKKEATQHLAYINGWLSALKWVLEEEDYLPENIASIKESST